MQGMVQGIASGQVMCFTFAHLHVFVCRISSGHPQRTASLYPDLYASRLRQTENSEFKPSSPSILSCTSK